MSTREIPFEKSDAKVSLNSQETDLTMSILCQVVNSQNYNIWWTVYLW